MFPNALAAVAALSLATAPAPFWIGQLGLEQAWSQARGAGVTVGLVDTGVTGGTAELAGAVEPGMQFPDLGGGTEDSTGHGTQMARLIAGRTNGVAPAAKIRPAKLSGGADQANAAIRWLVDQHVGVINLSMGSGSQHSTVFDDGLTYARDHDVVVVAAAGNAATDTGVTSPADGPGVVAVSAVDKDGRFRPDISVQGAKVMLAAPGVDMLGHSGTSEAAAVVSGVAALVRSKFPDLSARDVVDQLTTTAHRTGASDRDPQYGFGIVDPIKALTRSAPAKPGWQLPVAIGGAVAVVAGVGWLSWRRRPARHPTRGQRR